MTIPKTLQKQARAVWASAHNPFRTTNPTEAQINVMARAARLQAPQLPMTRDALFRGAEAARAAAGAGMAPERAAQVGINVARDFSALQTSGSRFTPVNLDLIRANGESLKKVLAMPIGPERTAALLAHSEAQTKLFSMLSK
jgi:hypothetical protein